MLDVLYGQVDVSPVLAVVAVAVVVNLIAFVILAAGIVHQHHVVGEQLFVTILLKERHRGVMFRLHRVALCVGAHVVELRRRNAQVQHQHAVDSAEHGGFLLLQGGRLGAFGSKVTEPEGVFLQLQRNEIGHTGGVLATVGLRHGTLGHKTVFGNDIRHSGECASVTQRMFQQPLHCFVVQRLFRSVDDALQEKVGLLQLVPKERIYLRELERPETIACKGFGTHHVQPCEEPATP